MVTTAISAVLVIAALIIISRYIVRSLWRQLGGDPETAHRFADDIAAGNVSATVELAPDALVVDDNLVNQMVAARLLQQLGVNVVRAGQWSRSAGGHGEKSLRPRSHGLPDARDDAPNVWGPG